MKRNGFRAENVTAAASASSAAMPKPTKKPASDLEFADVAPMHHA